MRALVTGSAGHIGGAIARRLSEAGHEVIGLDCRASGTSAFHTVRAVLGTPDLPEMIVSEVERCEVIIHAAADLGLDFSVPLISVTNCVGTHEVIDIARRWSVERLVYISSIGVIGRPRVLPITEDHPAAPATAYHASKLYGEHLMNIAAANGVSTVSLRITAPVGPGMGKDRILPVFIRLAASGEALRIFGRGTRRQDYVHVRDIAQATVLCVQKAGVTGVLNIGSGQNVSNRELAELCVRITGSRSQIVFAGNSDPDEGVSWEVSTAAARSLIGYEPQVSIEQTIRDMAHADADRNLQ